MNLNKVIPTLAIAITVSACGGSNFEWFPSTQDTTPPVISAKAKSANVVFKNTSTMTISLPDTVVFTANEPTTIYYTTSGIEPVIPDSPHKTISNINGGSVDGPVIEETDTLLIILGVDKGGNKVSQSFTIVSP
jgi:hypothetical protein